MLPNSPSTSSSIHINPKFRNVHINPNFLSKSSSGNHQASEPTTVISRTQIYINPKFLNELPSTKTMAITQITNSTSLVHHPDEDYSQSSAHEFHESSSMTVEPLADTKIHTRTKIINHCVKQKVADPLSTRKTVNNIENGKSLIKIGSKKLVRVPVKSYKKSSETILTLRRPLQTKYKIVKEQTAFKIDRRSARAKLASIATKTLAQAPSRKFWINESLMPTKTIRCNILERSKIIAPTLSSITARPILKTPSFLNINGILYKSSRRKLEKTTITSQYTLTKTNATVSKPKQSYRRLIVRGESFLLDANGKNLIRMQADQKHAINKTACTSAGAALITRIDIGKITFVKKSNNTYERTDYHKSRYHLNVAKQRSIQLLTNRLVKTNLPCPIYQKLGKCAAFVRGKCTKLHDKKLVDVCPRFLKGTCDKELCLLSHVTTLSKMPTCKFYLQGMCSKTDCPYLHKKVNDKTEICVDFLRGFCEKAEKCMKRHEFLCPEQQSKGVCPHPHRCPYPHRAAHIQIEHSHIEGPERPKITSKRLKAAKKSTAKISEQISTDKEPLSVRRYFIGETMQSAHLNIESRQCLESENPNSVTENVEKIIVVRKPILGSLPSFIPIG